jgi:hypothetical protein
MNATPEKTVSSVMGSRARTVRSTRIAAADAPARMNIAPAVK